MSWWRRRREYLDDLPRTHDIRFAMVFVILFVGAFAVLYGVGYAVAGDTVPPGTSVGGVNIGGLSRAEAEARLEAAFSRRETQPITATVGGRRFSVSPDQAGFGFDASATLDAVMGGPDWNPRHMVRVLLGGGSVQPVVTVAPRWFGYVLKPIAFQVATSPVDAAVSFAGGAPAVLPGRPGTRLSLAAAQSRLVAAYAAGQRQVTLPLTRVNPAIDPVEAHRFVTQVAAPATSAAVHIAVGSRTVTVSPRRFGPALVAKPVQGRLRLTIDATALHRSTAALLAALPGRPRSASLALDAGHLVVRPSRSGFTVAPDVWAKAVLRAATGKGSKRTATARTQKVQPRLTTAALDRLRITEPVSTVSLRLPVDTNFVVLDGAARALDSTIIRPGASLSFLKTVRVGADDQSLSTLSSAVFGAALRAGLAITEVHPRAVATPGFPPAMDAQVVPGKQDLVVADNTPYGVFVHAQVNRAGPTGQLMVQLWSTSYWKVSLKISRSHLVPHLVRQSSAPGCTPQQGSDGYDAVVARTRYRDGSLVATDDLPVHYRPVDAVVCH
ncbi:MAG TPA: VanW family protein [Nocardioidaceae bacterium]|nr:VanW family protein [Nocardioidaceae bacterium]